MATEKKFMLISIRDNKLKVKVDQVRTFGLMQRYQKIKIVFVLLA